MLSQIRQKLAQTFLAALHENEIPWHKCWGGTRPLNLQTGREYRGVNNLFLSYAAMEKGYRDPRWMTFKQAADRGWHVRKGEKAERVEFWHYYDSREQKIVEEKEVQRLRVEEPERMKQIRLAAYTYCVFNGEQVDGVEPFLGGRRPDVERLKRSRDIFLSNLGVAFREGGDRAFYQFLTDSIVLPYPEHFTSDYAYACTLLHEAGHATAHPSRLDRPLGAGYGTPEYAREELRAEIASAFTAQALGLSMDEGELKENTDQHKAYIQSWIAVLEKDPNELFAAIRDADKIADYLVEQGQLLVLGTEPEHSESNGQSPQLHMEQGLELEL